MPTSFNAGRLALATTLALTLLGFARMSFANDAALVADAKHTIGVFKKTAPGIDKFFRNSAGYVVCPGIGKGGESPRQSGAQTGPNRIRRAGERRGPQVGRGRQRQVCQWRRRVHGA